MKKLYKNMYIYAAWNGDCVGNAVRSSIWSKKI